jgi:hypothetical protein
LATPNSPTRTPPTLRTSGARLSSPKKLEKDLRELPYMRHARARLSLGSREKNGKSFAGRRPQTLLELDLSEPLFSPEADDPIAAQVARRASVAPGR